MTGLLSGLPVWGIAIAIFLARAVDVTIGTVRTIAVVHGRTTLAVFLGFLEVCIWFAAVSEAVVRIGEAPWLLFAFAGGFAAGNASGIALERRLALGWCVVRMLSSRHGSEIARAIDPMARVVTTFGGVSGSEARALVYALCRRRDLPTLLQTVQAIDPEVFYAVERFAETSPLAPTSSAVAWRAASGMNPSTIKPNPKSRSALRRFPTAGLAGTAEAMRGVDGDRPSGEGGRSRSTLSAPSGS